MSGEEVARHLANIARCNFFGCGRPAVQFQATAASCWMSNPCQGGPANIADIGKYLNGGFHRGVQT